MPRDIGTGLYHYPDGTPGNTGQTIFSARYNTFINDLTNALNQPLPINVGGTGADNATQARDNLDAEVASVKVTDYNSQVWESGSFWSEAGSVGGPVAGHLFAGVAVVVNVDNISLIARDLDASSALYIRNKRTTWGPWINEKANHDLLYVNVAGDTMTGDLIISEVGPNIFLDRTDATEAALYGRKGGLRRWSVVVGTSHAESSTATGSNFYINRYNNAGTFIDTVFAIERDSGLGTVKGSPTDPLGIATKAYVDGKSADYVDVVGDTMTGALTILQPSGGLFLRSDAAGSPTYLGVGRTVNSELVLGIAAVANNILTGTIAGDGALNVPAGKLLFGAAGNTNLIFGASIGRASAFQAQWNITGNTNGLSMKGPDTTTTKAFVDFADSALVQCGAINVNQSAHTTAYATSSDERGKPNRVKISAPEARSVIDRLEVYDFDKDGNQIRGFGVVAQQAYEVHPSLAFPPSKEGDWWMVEKAAPVPFLIAALQGANQHIDKLEERLAALELKLAAAPASP